MQGRGWIKTSGLTVAASAANAFWSTAFSGQYRPIGKMLTLTGGSSDYLARGVKPWIDTAIGLNLMFNSIPSGGPHKLLEICQFAGTSVNPLYTLALLNGRFRIYAYAEVGSGNEVDEGGTWFLGDLAADTHYCIHFYARRSLRMLYVNGRQEFLHGGYSGLASTHSVRIYPVGSPYIDDFYQTWTQPAIWAGAYDTYFPYAYYDDATEDWLPHRVLTPKPVAELDVTPDGWEAVGGAGLIACTTGTDNTYMKKDILAPGGFQLEVEDVDFPDELLAYHWQLLARMRRLGSINQQGYYGEARIPGVSTTVQSDFMDASAALEAYWHTDTVGIANGDLKPSPKDFRTETNHARMMIMNPNASATPTWINQINWSLVDKFKPAIFTMGA